MNWYKKSNKAVPIPQQIYSQIDTIAIRILDAIIFMRRFFLENQKLPPNSINVGKIILPDDVPVSFKVNNILTSEDSSATCDIDKNEIAFNMLLWMLSKHNSESDILSKKENIKSMMVHELTHIIDPKPDEIKKKLNPTEEPRYKRPVELEAYSRQIIDVIGHSYNKGDQTDKDNIKEWLKYYNKKDFDDIPSHIKKSLGLDKAQYKIIQEWKNLDKIKDTMKINRKRKSMFRLFLTKLVYEIKLWDKEK